MLAIRVQFLVYSSSFSKVGSRLGEARVSLFTGLDYWNGILDWTTGMTIVLFCEVFE